MRVLITGGFGFLGGRLAQALTSQQGNEVVLATRHAPGQSPKTASWLPEAEVVGVEWETAASLERACRGCDAVVHLAGLNARGCADDPAAAVRVNGGYTAAMVQAAVRQGVRRFIHLSTAHVYASPLRGTIDESSPPEGTHPYATSHLLGEQSVREANARDAIEGIVVRLSNSFGAPMHVDVDCWTLLVNDLCRQAVTEGALTLNTAGLQRRDFIPMTDACSAIAHLLALPREAVRTDLNNVGGGWAPTTRAMAELIRDRCVEVLGREIPLQVGAARADDPIEPLTYCTDPLARSGWRAAGEREAEIDALLRFCVQHFRAA